MNNSSPITVQSPLIYRAIGVMSGTSLDGLDLCLADFTLDQNIWRYQFIKSTTIPYSKEFRERLGSLSTYSGLQLEEFNASYGVWIAERINEFKVDIKEPIDIIGSHGHTVFHNPAKGFTTQLGSGAHIAAITGIPCVCDFRIGDVARGGQGAPLVPIGDDLLFSDYDFCLNIGGIANLSYKKKSQRVAFDICPANMALNYFTMMLGFEYDENGDIGKTGEVEKDLLTKLDQLEYYNLNGPKSLGREWFEAEFLPIINGSGLKINNILRTLYEHIAQKICDAFSIIQGGKVLVTGGGARNNYLIGLIKSKCSCELIVPKPELIDYKEALIFGFLSILYKLQITSCLSSVTGSKSDSIGGCLYF
jgi:anhydro-N-acetylmuramic acid kinase